MLPIVIIGSGLAGYLLVKEYRQQDKERPITLITETDGRFYSKPLLSTAFTQKKTIDKLSVCDAHTMSKQWSVDIITHATVVSIDAEKKQIFYKRENQARSIIYSDLVLACGASKITPSLKGNGVTHIASVNNIEDYEYFCDWVADKNHIGILGAGLVGCEFANDLINNGYQVTVIAPEKYPLARWVPEPVGRAMVSALAEKGVKWILGQFAQVVDQEATHYRVILDNGIKINVDGVMSAVGLRPALDLAKTAGIKTNEGIVVDLQLRTSDRHIYALGDCAEVNGECRHYVAPLLQCVRILARVLLGQAAYLNYPVMPITIKTPACPLVVVLPPKGKEGSWFYQGEGSHLSALFKDNNGQLRGFALMGDKVREKKQLVEQIVLD